MTTHDECQPGEYQDEKRQQTCKPCAVGTASSQRGRKTACDACPPGQSLPEAGQDSCEAPSADTCPAGKYKLQTALGTVCVLCPEGYYQDAVDHQQAGPSGNACPRHREHRTH